VSRCQKRTSGLYGAREINRGRHTDYPSTQHRLNLDLKLHQQKLTAYYYIRLMAFFPGQPGQASTRKPFWILLEQEMMGWQWHQLDHMQIICTSL